MTVHNDISPQISIIVPVYNAERYLRQCIDSILDQTYTDFELLLINDGSRDHSGAICDDYAQKDARVRVFHKENGGVSSARNLGLDNARGEWITFVDADDCIRRTFISNLYAPLKQHYNIDFVHAGCSNWENGNVTSIEQQFEQFAGTDRAYLFNRFRGLIVSKLFKSDILNLNKIRFDERLLKIWLLRWNISSTSGSTFFCLRMGICIDVITYNLQHITRKR